MAPPRNELFYKSLTDSIARLETKVDHLTDQFLVEHEHLNGKLVTVVSPLEQKVDCLVKQQAEHAGYHLGLTEAQALLSEKVHTLESISYKDILKWGLSIGSTIAVVLGAVLHYL